MLPNVTRKDNTRLETADCPTRDVYGVCFTTISNTAAMYVDILLYSTKTKMNVDISC